MCAMIDQIKKINPSASVGIIVIADAGSKFIDKVAGIQEAIDAYNQLLADIESRYQCKGNVSLINPFSHVDCQSLLLPDGHHLTVEGHAEVAQAVIAFLGKSSDHLSGSAKVSSVSSTVLQ